MNLTDRDGNVLSVKSRSLEETRCLNTLLLLIEMYQILGAKNTSLSLETVELIVNSLSFQANFHLTHLLEDYSHSHE